MLERQLMRYVNQICFMYSVFELTVRRGFLNQTFPERRIGTDRQIHLVHQIAALT